MLRDSAAILRKVKRVKAKATSSYLKSTVELKLVPLHRHQVEQSRLVSQLLLENLLPQSKANQEPKKKRRLRINLLRRRTPDARKKWKKRSAPRQRFKHS